MTVNIIGPPMSVEFDLEFREVSETKWASSVMCVLYTYTHTRTTQSRLQLFTGFRGSPIFFLKLDACVVVMRHMCGRWNYERVGTTADRCLECFLS